MELSFAVTVLLCGAALFAAVRFVFNPLGLGPAPAVALGDGFFARPAADLSDLHLLIDGKEAFAAALDAIDAARVSIVVQTFIWRADAIGKQVAERLLAAADRGVRVSIGKDMLGTYFELGDMLRGKRSPVFSDKRLRRHENIHIVTGFFRDPDHSKYFIADRRTVVFGGMNIADEYHTQWHDYMARIDHTRWAAAFEAMALRAAPWAAVAPFVVAVNDRRATEIRTAYIEMIDRAQTSLVIEHAYVSTTSVIDAVKRAAGRGVKVDVILPKRPGTHHYANMATINRLLEAEPAQNLRIFLYPRMTHAKVALADGVIAAVGSANLTPRSMFTCREVTLFAHGRPEDAFIKRLGERLEADIHESEPVIEPFPMSFIERTGALLGKYTY